MRRRRLAAAALILIAGVAAFLALTRVPASAPGALAERAPDLANGETMYRIGGCFACHRPPEGTAPARASLPLGGTPFPTPIGTFYPGNLTPDARTGLGAWSESDFLAAMTRGVSPDRRHYFPAFPWRSYAVMREEDLRDLWAFLRTLPAADAPGRPPDLPLEALARRGVGLWKRLAPEPARWVPDPARGPAWNRGGYLVSAPGHCGECHTRRNLLMFRDERFALGGGMHPGGEGKVPSLRRLIERERYEDAADLALALQYGETLGYDKLSSGGMGKIQAELAQLDESDLRAIAEYLVSLD